MNSAPNLHPMKKILLEAAKPVLNRVLALRNRHQEESCYIFGDGISVKWFDLHAFPEKPVLTLNYLPYHRQAEALNLRYGVFHSPYYFYPYRKLPWPPKTWWRNRIQNKYRQLIRDRADLEYFVNLSNYPVLKGDNLYFLFRTIDDWECEFLNDCHSNGEGIYDGSFRCAIALAIYMGFSEIYLVGCDYTHEKSRSLHWYEKGEGVFYPQPNYQRRYLEIATKYAKITTITMDGGGSVLPAMTYTKFTGYPLSFRENHELTDIATLKLLATWPGYNIF